MTLKIGLPDNTELEPKICILGVGGAGGNAVKNMISGHLEGVEFWVLNTDAQALGNSPSSKIDASQMTAKKIQLGPSSTRGLGAGSHPEVGKLAAEESLSDVYAALEGCNMVFITAGMGGGTGTGAAPVIAKAAKERGILTVGVVTKPFHFEGSRRMNTAELGISEMQKYSDTLIIIPNQNLFRMANDKTTFADAFKLADNVLHSAVRGVTDLITMPGLINLDFADIRTVMSEMGKAMMGTGEAEGEDRAIKAAEAAISNPLLDNTSMKGAKGVIINITGGLDMTLYEVDASANFIRKVIEDSSVPGQTASCNIIFGAAFNENLEGKIRVSVVATGIDAAEFAKTKTTISFVPQNLPESQVDYNKDDTFELEAETVPSLHTEVPANSDAFIPSKPYELSEFGVDEKQFEEEDKEEEGSLLSNDGVANKELYNKNSQDNMSLFGKVAMGLGMSSSEQKETGSKGEREQVPTSGKDFEIPAFLRRRLGK